MRPVTSSYRKADEIVRDMRDRIVSGQFNAGERIPTRDELSASYGVSKVTVQRALDQLRVEGFLVPHGRHGTFVAENGPHQSRYALLFPHALQTQTRNQLYTALVQQAESMAPEANFQAYYGFEGRAGFHNYESLLADVQANRLAGLVFASPPFLLSGTPLLTRPGVPRVAFMTGPQREGVAAVTLDGSSFLRLALAELAGLGRRRPLVLMSATPSPRALENLQRLCDTLQIELRDTWVQGVALSAPHWAERLVRLVLDRSRRDWPDSVVVCDDNLLEPTTVGLQACGVQAPRDMHIVSLANFPWPTPSHLPATRIGPDIREALRACMQAIDAQRNGEPPGHVVIPARHEADLLEATNAPQWLPNPMAAGA